MIKILKYTVTFYLFSILCMSSAYAYLDGGTGSILLQSMLAGVAGFLAVLKLYWQKIKKIFRSKKPTQSVNSKDAATQQQSNEFKN